MATVVISAYDVVNYPQGGGHFWVYLQYVLGLADLLLNFHYAISPALLSFFRHTALVDIDPGLLQFWITSGQLRVPRHDFHFSTAEGVGRRGGKIPSDNPRWIHIRPAICLERWPYTFDPCCKAFTTVSTWHSSDWVVAPDETYETTQRVALLEFDRLPQPTPQP